MKALETLYDLSPNIFCKDCSILGKPKSDYCIKEDDLRPSKILFLSDSFKFLNGSYSAFRREEMEVILSSLEKLGFSNLIPDIAFSTSVKCPGVREADMTKDDRDKCRNHLYATIERVKPKLIFACGNLPLVMLTKRSGVGKKRGKEFEIELDSGFKTIVVPLFHPWQVIAEPGNSYLFDLDIQNAINAIILQKFVANDFKFTMITDLKILKEYDWLKTTDKEISVDVESTGLDFNVDKITTIAFSWEEGDKITNIVLPLNHFENPCPHLLPDFILFVDAVLRNKNNRKYFHSGKFDIKMLYQLGCKVIENPWDTKFMMHIFNENLPKSLKDCVGYFFSNEVGMFKEKTLDTELEEEEDVDD